MKQLMTIGGNVVALIGVLACLVAGLARVSGHYYLFGYEAMTVFMGGVGLMVAACLAKLQALAVRG